VHRAVCSWQLNALLTCTAGGWHGGWPRLLDGIVLSKQYLPPDEEPCAAALAAPSAAAPSAAAAGSGSLAAAGASGGVPNCELPRLVARCRRDQLAFADVVLVAADGTEFECHKVVLAAQSPVFHSMLQADMQVRGGFSVGQRWACLLA
jgi:hypothetical protein